MTGAYIKGLSRPALARVFEVNGSPLRELEPQELLAVRPSAIFVKADDFVEAQRQWQSPQNLDLVNYLRVHPVTLVLDSSCEGPAAGPELLGRVLTTLGADRAAALSVVYVTQNEVAAEQANRAGSLYGGRCSLSAVTFNYFARALVRQVAACLKTPDQHLKYVSRLFPSPRRDRPKRYLSFNNRPAVHRLILVGWLKREGHLNQGWVSLLGGAASQRENFAARSERDLTERFAAFKDDYDIGRQLWSGGGLAIPLEQAGAATSPELPLAPFEQSYFSIVTESEMSTGGIRRFTEKSVKALLCGHPMIVLGNAFTLRDLRSMGFKTFHDYWNEDYDAVASPAERLSMALQEIDRLLTIDAASFRDMMIDLWPIVDHNIRNAQGMGLEVLTARERRIVDLALAGAPTL